ncbi:hypothetical protein [Neobacillus vireti]|uniref:Lipoprotein n=1 Tax=Neobacillus vireti LMG 21834 TaxID=1131730 RepID=A0AB94INH5_9BACI|nr:hypothetical protein [Neobacillus vireti]ETI68584.1 hypothetical protein BAVI_11769 [Neobacillus vireti LMG 21834]KLT16551.1 hypothetical protein AA980_19035 [Neobacillus vireti]
MKKFMVFLMISLVLTGCSKVGKLANFTVISQSEIEKSVSIKEVEFDTDKINSLYSGFNEEDLEDGLYLFNTDGNTRYVLFNSKGVKYSNISFTIQDNVLKITYDSEVDEGLEMRSFFSISKKNENDFDTIILENNGKQDHFNINFL